MCHKGCNSWYVSHAQGHGATTPTSPQGMNGSSSSEKEATSRIVGLYLEHWFCSLLMSLTSLPEKNIGGSELFAHVAFAHV